MEGRESSVCRHADVSARAPDAKVVQVEGGTRGKNVEELGAARDVMGKRWVAH